MRTLGAEKVSVRVVAAVCVCVAGMWGSVGFGQTEPAGKGVTLESVRQEISEFKSQLSKAQPTGAGAGERVRLRGEVSRLFEMMNNVADSLDEGRYDSALQHLRSGSSIVQSDDYRQKLTTLTEEITKLQATDQATLGDRMQALLKRVPEAIRSAKKGDDLNGLAVELQAAERRMNEGRMTGDARVTQDQVRLQLSQYTNAVQRYAELLNLEADGDTEGAWQTASQLLNVSFNGRAVPARDVIQQHLDALDKKRSEKIQKEFDALATKAQQAKSSADLAPVLDELQTLNNRAARGNGGLQAQRIYAEQQLLQTWGKVLDAEGKKKYRTALSAILEWRQGGRVYREGQATMIPDEMLTQKVTSLQKAILENGDDYTDPLLKPAADALDKAQSFEELQKAAEAVERLTTGVPMSMDADLQPKLQELRDAANQIQALTEMEGAIQAREWARFWELSQAARGETLFGNGEQHGNRWGKAINAQRMKLVREAVSECAEFKSLKITVQENEPLDKAILNAADAAIKAEDYRHAVLVLEVYSTYAYGGRVYPGAAYASGMGEGVPEMIRAEVQGLQLYASGKSFEAAGDLVSAVASYRGVLRLSGERVPLEKATERLAAIGKSNPELLKQASEEPSDKGAARPGVR